MNVNLSAIANFVVNICEAAYDYSIEAPPVYVDLEIIFTLVLYYSSILFGYLSSLILHTQRR